MLVAVTQQLSLENELAKSQTLTATHDKTSAWGGLGSAFLSLWRQFQIPSSIMGTVFIALYLGLIALLHNTTPALIGTEVFNMTFTKTTVTTKGFPDRDRLDVRFLSK